MFALLIGLMCLVLSVIYREWSLQDDALGDAEGASYNAFVAVATLILAIIFILTGAVGV